MEAFNIVSFDDKTVLDYEPLLSHYVARATEQQWADRTSRSRKYRRIEDDDKLDIALAKELLSKVEWVPALFM